MIRDISFCAKLLKERPIEIAFDPDFKELEDTENSIEILIYRI
jgi:ATP-dependent helicase/nuclease subunit A